MPTSERWVIIYKNDGFIGQGLYIDQQITRVEAIAKHVACYEDVSSFTRDGGLTDAQRAAWKRCRARGDRAVKAKIVWEFPE